jgi:AraC family transcriptional regulator, arabinose operon regulatory protein
MKSFHDLALDPALSILAGYAKETLGYHIHRERGTPNWLIVYTLSGAGKVVHRDGDTIVFPESLSIWHPNSLHDYSVSTQSHESSHQWEQLWVHVTPNPSYEVLLNQITARRPFSVVEVPNARHAEALMRQVTSCPRTSLGELKAVNLLEAFLIDYVDFIGETVGEGVVDLARRFILAHLHQPFGIPELAKAVGLSPSRLTTICRVETGLAPRQLIERERLILARQLLRMTSQPIQSIAFDLGYANAFYFTQRFKKETGLNPTEYRKSA